MSGQHQYDPDAPEFVPQEHQYNSFKEDVPAAFRAAMDSIYGLPFGGSLAFIGQDGQGLTEWKGAGQGVAFLQMQQGDISIEVSSAGFLDGNFAHLLINGVDYSPNQKGINILVIDPETLDAYVGAFDTHTHIGNESHHLTKFLASIPLTHIVLMAIRHDASRRLHPAARHALQLHGVDIPDPDNAEALQDAIDSCAFKKSRASELLSIAATINAPKCARVLLEYGWNVDYQRKHGSRNTALLDAAFHGSIETLEVLLEFGVDRTIMNKWNETAEDIATKLFGFESLEMMCEAPDSMNLTMLDVMESE